MQRKGYTKKELKELILAELPKLLKRDKSLKEHLVKLLEDSFAEKKKTEDRFEILLQENQKIWQEVRQLRLESEKKWEEWKKKWEENEKKWEEWNRRWEENQREWNRKWEESQKEWNRRWEENQREWNRKWEESQKKWEEWNRRWEESQREWNKRWEESQKKWEEWNRRWEEYQREWNKRWEESQREWNKRWEESNRRIETLFQEIKFLHRKYDTTLGALGARWGLRTEASFREAMKGILEESFPVKVERYLAKDEEGVVFGRPDQIEIDLIIKDGEVIASEIKSSVSKADVLLFLKKVDFYEKKEGVKVKRKVIISPMVEPGVKEFALSLGVEVYSYPDEVELKEESKEEVNV